jgi:hypothetical protein
MGKIRFKDFIFEFCINRVLLVFGPFFERLQKRSNSRRRLNMKTSWNRIVESPAGFIMSYALEEV